MRLPLHIIDAFTVRERSFSGNPAAVCLLEKPLEDSLLQQIAQEMNLSETAFLLANSDPSETTYSLRWFTPLMEVDLCGHATLASAHLLWQEGVVAPTKMIQFQTRSGELQAEHSQNGIVLNFPARPPVKSNPPAGMLEALTITPRYIGSNGMDYLIEVGSEAELRSLSPDFTQLKRVETRGVIVTCRSENQPFDFVSRFFAPSAGVNEDPVTGSAHCYLAPYWSQKMGKQKFIAYQASARGGILHVELRGERVLLSGKAKTTVRGELFL
jgi:PhzF family phenazine biosynthesis protein